MLIAVLGFTSRSQAQTQEETEAWIKEKLEKFAFIENEVIKINECEIVIKSYLLKGRKDIWNEITLPTNPVGVSSYDLHFKSKVVKNFESDTNKVEYRNVVPLMNFSREDDLGKRFLKAVQHLNTFFEKKNEAF